MSTYTQLLYHIVFSTKYRRYTLDKSKRESLFKYMNGIIKKLNSVPYRINGVGDHVHILVRIHPAVSLSDLIKIVKSRSTIWIKENKIFPYFTSWQEGYGAFSYSHSQIENVYNYILNQEEHHARQRFQDEYKGFLKKFEIEHNIKYLFEWMD